MEAKATCSNCGALLNSGSDHCTQCGEVLTLRRAKIKAPGQTLMDFNKFLLVAMIFIVAIVTLGLFIF